MTVTIPVWILVFVGGFLSGYAWHSIVMGYRYYKYANGGEQTNGDSSSDSTE